LKAGREIAKRIAHYKDQLESGERQVGMTHMYDRQNRDCKEEQA
jgi:hypothetical protein